MITDLDKLTPKETVKELDKYIIGQDKAKKAVAIALRNRMRRRLLPQALMDEITPKNIIMIGPTGVGKTEIARRLSKLCGAPFLKVEATKFTEVGYVGRDVESMIRDLMSIGLTMVKKELSEEVKEEAEKRTEEVILDLLLPGIKKKTAGTVKTAPASPGQLVLPVVSEPVETIEVEDPGKSTTREKFRKMLREGSLDDKIVEVDISSTGMPAIEIFSGTNFEEMDLNLGNLGSIFGGKKKKKKVTVKRAKEIVLTEEKSKLVDSDKASDIAKERVEQMGIIFIDEIDKVASKEGRSGADVSREGVQRDILPIIEGSKVNTKYGIVDTSHILFIAAGAFHISKPSDLIPELQGRFPIRVELDDLDSNDFHQILTQTENSLTIQYTELLKTEGVSINFTDEATVRLSEIAAEVNTNTENIGARRLHTIMELLLEDVSFNAPDLKGQEIPITPEYVDNKLGNIVKNHDLSRYIL
ncbi:MAG: ATP-dependent protease ATPase subunit HslU [Spirochaetaceae bacterium]|nr:ATP-dependent protease ATPase subunit HslU [Spirochaetaceae bacterium]